MAGVRELPGTPLLLTLALILTLTLTATLACVVPPYSCPEAKCNDLPTTYVNPSLNYSAASTWKLATMKHIAIYKGVYNKLLGVRPDDNSLAAWLALRGSTTWLNLERFPVEYEFVIGGAGAPNSLKGCCNLCRVTQGCVEYLFQPSSYASGASLDSGTCFMLTGGKYKGDGPYNKVTGVEYGTPNSSTSAYQRDSNSANKNKMGYLGGYCNPGNDTTNVVDDPHFTGARGTRFDFNGELGRAFCLVTDARIHINALLKGYKSSNTFGATVGADGKGIRSWIRELGFLWSDAKGKSHSLHLVAREGKEMKRGEGFLAKAELDGATVTVPASVGSAYSDSTGDVSLTFLGTSQKGPYEVDRFQLVIGTQLDATLEMRAAHVKLQAPGDAEVHFNLQLNDIATTDRVHGVLGQTYRATPSQALKALKFSALGKLLGAPVKADGDSGAGFLDGSVGDYESSHVLKADCKVATFSA